MKKYVLIGVLLVCGVGYLTYYYVSSQKNESANNKIESTLDRSNTLFSNESKSQSIDKTIETSSQEMDELDIEMLIKRFCYDWLNFSDVYQRNQAVKPYVTDECAEENTLDVDPHVEYDSTGQIDSIAQDIDHPNNYVVIGKEKSQDYVNVFILELELTKDKTKIAKIDMSYVKKGY